MPKAERPFARIYYEDLIRDYGPMFMDNDALATYVRLLSVADKMWPTPPEIPARVGRPFASLVRSGLVELVAGHRYTIRGYATDRSKRSDAGRVGADVRWHSDRTPDGNANGKRSESDRNPSGDAIGMPTPTPTPTPTPFPPPPTSGGGSRKAGTNGRATGSNPRANGTSPRQVEEETVRRAPERLGEILGGIAAFNARQREEGS